MEQRTRVGLGVAGTVGLFLCIQVGALALVEPYVEAGAQPVEDPSDPGNVGLFFGIILIATALMLAAIRYDLARLIRGVVLFACGWVAWFVLSTVAAPLAPAEPATLAETALAWAVVIGPALLGIGVVLALVVHPEWYVIDAAGVLLGAGAAGLFGYAFQPHLTVAFLVVLAVYDAISVYGTEHMLTLAEGVSELNVPVLLVVPTSAGYSLRGDEGPETTGAGPDGEGETDAEAVEARAAEGAAGSDDPEHDAEADPENVTNLGPEGDRETDRETQDEPLPGRDAIYIGLGDAVMPTILVASAAYFLQDAAPLLDVPLLAVNLPALGALVGTLVGLLALLWLVLRGRAHAGLPLLNGGAIAGYLLGATASGITVAEALGLPL